MIQLILGSQLFDKTSHILRRTKMRILVGLFLSTFLIAAPMHSQAAHHEKKSAVEKVASAAKKNPGTTVGVAACGVAIAFFPPAALVCGGAIAAGAGVDSIDD